MSFMMSFGWTSMMLCLGMLLRAKIPIFRNMLVPSSVIGGIIGFIFVNVVEVQGIEPNMLSAVVNNLFTISFISITLINNPGKENKNILKGTIGMGLVWCFLYALTPLIATGVIFLLERFSGMDHIYGMLVQFAFCQGPGQAAAYGAIFEQYGWENSSMVALAFAVIGFIAAFSVGIPAAKLGIRKGIAKHCGKLDESVLKGYMSENDQTVQTIKDSTHNSNIETLSVHFALIGVCYVLAVGISRILELIPGFLGSSMSAMMFMNGMYAAYIVKWVLKKCHLDFLLDNVLQRKIVGWTSDYLVVYAFMAISIKVIYQWLLPIVIVSGVITLITFGVCFYFGQRFGGTNDFERTLGLYGTCTGTVPSGISLIRIVDPDFQTTTSIELGACNLVMLASTPVYIIILATISGTLSIFYSIVFLFLCIILYLIALKITKTWGQKTFSWK